MLDGSGSADDEVADDFDTHFREDVDFLLDDGFWESEFWDSVDHHTAGLVEGLEYSDIVAYPPGVTSSDDTAGARADYSNFHSSLGCDGRDAVFVLVKVCGKSFQPAD
ncbi:hypothetical protein ES703_25617 [subsurface metagenome]